MHRVSDWPADRLAPALREARQRTLHLVADLDDDQLLGPRLDIVNPLLWEIGHVAWFQEKWVLRRDGAAPLRPDADDLYDSIAIAHDLRWDLPLPRRDATVAYLLAVLDRALDTVATADTEQRYHLAYALFHEDMHGEAFTYTRQTLSWPPPPLPDRPRPRSTPGAGALDGDVDVPGVTVDLGADPDDQRFVFDNEKWAHRVRVEPFAIARAQVTQAAFAAFVDDGGYERRELWTDEGWAWRQQAGADHPVYWRRGDGGWERRHFDRWVPLEPHRPVIHVNAHEARAFCRHAGRRLPTEAEWQVAASFDPATGQLRRLPWGEAPPSPERARLDWLGLGCADVADHPAGDSALGCRQMVGNTWEWTATPFEPYPGFTPDPYREYSEPWFSTRLVLRGGAWATRSRLVRTTLRNFFEPHRRDVFAGFRTCAP